MLIKLVQIYEEVSVRKEPLKDKTFMIPVRSLGSFIQCCILSSNRVEKWCTFILVYRLSEPNTFMQGIITNQGKYYFHLPIGLLLCVGSTLSILFLAQAVLPAGFPWRALQLDCWGYCHLCILSDLLPCWQYMLEMTNFLDPFQVLFYVFYPATYPFLFPKYIKCSTPLKTFTTVTLLCGISDTVLTFYVCKYSEFL